MKKINILWFMFFISLCGSILNILFVRNINIFIITSTYNLFIICLMSTTSNEILNEDYGR